jgi:hypothetical protein
VKGRASNLIVLAPAKIAFALDGLMLDWGIIDQPDVARHPANGVSDIVHHLLHYNLIEGIVYEENRFIPRKFIKRYVRFDDIDQGTVWMSRTKSMNVLARLAAEARTKLNANNPPKAQLRRD